MDTMTVTKIAGGLCGLFLVFLLGKWAAEEIYHVGGHGEQAYVIDTGVEEAAEPEEDAVPFEEVLASADPDKGAGVFRKCQACHKIEPGVNATGPSLYGVVGRDIGSVEGFGYSDTLASMEGDWTPEHLNGFLENPKSYAPNTTMGFAGLPKVEDRANVIAYLESLGN